MSSPKKTKPFETPFELLKKSILVYRLKFKTFFFLGLVVFLISVMQLLAIRTHSMVVFFSSVIATIVVSYIVYIAEIRVATDPAEMTAWQAFKRVEHYLLPSLWVSGAILLVALGGTLLLGIPGIILTIFIMFSLFAVVSDHYEMTEAVTYSWHVVKGRWFKVFFRLLVANICIGLTALIIIGFFWLFGIGETPWATILRAHTGDYSVSISQTILSEAVGNFFVLPMSLIFMAELYESLKRTTAKEPTEKEVRTTKHLIRIFAGLGAVFIVIGFFLSTVRLAQVIPQVVRITHAPASVFSAF